MPSAAAPSLSPHSQLSQAGTQSNAASPPSASRGTSQEKPLLSLELPNVTGRQASKCHIASCRLQGAWQGWQVGGCLSQGRMKFTRKLGSPFACRRGEGGSIHTLLGVSSLASVSCGMAGATLVAHSFLQGAAREDAGFVRLYPAGDTASCNRARCEGMAQGKTGKPIINPGQ